MKTTKRSLLASGLAVLVCIAMLAGTTFAWFTDSVVNKGNKIQSGSLSIDAYAYDLDKDGTGGFTIEGVNGGNPFSFEEEGQDLKKDPNPILNETLWEPGKSSAKLLKVQNNGTLAAKIKLEFVLTDGGLQDALWFDFVQVKGGKVTGQFTKRPMSELATIAQDLELPVLKDESLQFILVYGMNEEAGNEYQDKNFSADIAILATQYTEEEDGFGNDQYDKDAEYLTTVSTTEDFMDAVKNASENETIQLTQDIKINDIIPQSQAGDTRIDLNGKTLSMEFDSITEVNGQKVAYCTQVTDSLTVENGTVKRTGDFAWNALDIAVKAGATLNLNNVTWEGAGFQPEGQDATLNIVDSKIKSGTYCVSTNASDNGKFGGVDINISNSTLECEADNSDNAAILFNIPGTLDIKDSTLIGQRQGLIVRGGTANLINCTVKTTGQFDDQGKYDNANWGSGNEVPAAALVIGNRSNSAYRYPATCYLENTTVSNDNGGTAVYLYGNPEEGNGATLTHYLCDIGTIVQGDNGAYSEVKKLDIDESENPDPFE
ncbi:hypothetical protein NIF40_07005 [[Clostridium] leptum]|nr:hypothetical protein [[Clostridium] leptum]